MRKFLVVLDDSQECLSAMRFAAMRAQRTGAGVTILSVIPPDDFKHWVGVGDIMQKEAVDRIKAHFEVFAQWMRDKQNVDPELAIREGDPAKEVMAHIEDDPAVGVLVLGASVDRKGPGPLVAAMIKNMGNLPVPVTVVPGNLTKDRLVEIT